MYYLSCKSESHGFEFWWGHWIFQFTYSFQPLCDSGVNSASNRNEAKERSALKADNLTTISEPIIKTIWDSGRLTTLWTYTTSLRDSSIF
jgi:hypothetical protein